MILEDRYIIIKFSDLDTSKRRLLDDFMSDNDIRTREAAVAEKDWPCYAAVVGLILEQPPYAHLTINDPGFADMDPEYIERLRDAFANPAASCLSTATGADLDRIATTRGATRTEGETDEVFRQRIRDTHNLSKATRHIGFNPLLAAPYEGTRYNKDDLPTDPYAGMTFTGTFELSKMTPETFREQYECTPRSAHQELVDALLKSYAKLDRRELEALTDRELLRMVETHMHVPAELVRALKRQVAMQPDPWTQHDGGPCPVRHEEVEVQTRGSVTGPRRCWPESVNWHWGRPGSPTTPIDVLRWRRV